MNPIKKTETPTETPWGPSQFQRAYGEGITQHVTAGHGGFFVSDERRAEMPESCRNFAPFAGAGWYEEDCDWAVVAVAFPSEFQPQTVATARRMLVAHADYFAKRGLQS